MSNKANINIPKRIIYVVLRNLLRSEKGNILDVRQHRLLIAKMN